MQLLKPCVVLWASLLVLMPSGAHAAVMLKNSMSTDIKSVFGSSGFSVGSPCQELAG
ncbi:hypothetical protein [Desulfovibrio desulfuricans]|uniref:hypothetical protein n=1 Tax=Desulfovibrio desulfuricans TaxID=876 RepID=UPI0035B161FB